MRKRVRSTPRVVLLLTLLCGGPLIPSPTLGQAAGDERQERLQERDRLWAEARRLRAQGQLEKAITAAEKMLAIERAALGAEHPEVAVFLEWLAKVYVEREDFAAARKARQEVLSLRGKLHGMKPWQVTDARLALADVERLAALSPDQRRRLAEANQSNQRVVELRAQGKYREALELAQKALTIRQQLLGEEHPDYAACLNNLAMLYRAMVAYDRAEPLYRQALEITKKALGEEHPDYAITLNNLARLYYGMGAYDRAEPLLRQALEIRKKVLGEEHPDYAISLNNLAELYRRMGAYDRAEPLYRQALEIKKKALGEGHPDYATSLNGLAELYYALGAYDRAEPLLLQALKIRKKVLGEEHPDYATSLNGLAELYYALGAYDRAEPLLLQALKIRKKVLGEEHPDYATSLNNLAKLYYALGAYDRAEPLCRQALEIWKKVLGEEHPDYATSLNNLAELYRAMGAYDRAEPLYRQALEIRKKVLGEEYPDYATSLNNLAKLYCAMGAYDRAEPLYREALEIRKKVLGEEHPDYAACLNDLAALYYARGAYDRAEPLYRQALEITKKALGEGHPDYAISLNNLALLYYAMGAYDRAEPLYRQALEIRKKVLGEEHPDYATGLNNLAALYGALGAYDRAEPLYRQALEIKKKALGEGHPDYASCLNNLAALYRAMGAYDRAEPLYREALEIRKKALGEGHPAYAISLNSLAELYHAMGAYDRAEPLYREALEIMKKALGEGHPTYATGLNNLAALYYAMGAYDRAERRHRQALEIRKKALGEGHPDYATSLNNLALLYYEMGAYDRAEPLFRQALEIRKKALGEGHPDYAISLNNLALLYYAMGAYDRAEPLCRQALEIRKKALGEEHPDYAISLSSLASLYQATNRPQQALTTLGRGMEVEQFNLGRVFAFSAEPAMRDYLDTVSRSLYGLLSIVIDGAATDPAAAETALTWTLRRKAVILQALCRFRDAQRRLAQDPALAQQALQFRGLRQRLSDWTLNPPPGASPETLRHQMDAWRQQADEVEADLNRALARHEQAQDPVLAQQAFQLRGLWQRLSDWTLNPPPGASPETLRHQMDAWRQQADELEAGLNRALARHEPQSARDGVDAAALRRRLPAGSALVELVRVDLYDFRATGFDLRLMSSLNDVSGIPTEGKNLIVVAAVNNVLHFRSFDGDGKVVVDTDEKRLTEQARKVEDLRKQLERLWPTHELTRSEKARVFTAVTSVVGHTLATVRAPRWKPAHYLAFVLTAGAQAPPRLIDLGDAAAIDDAVDLVRQSVIDAGSEFTDLAKTDKSRLPQAERTWYEEGFRQVSRPLYQQVFAPLRAALGPATLIYLAPDGELNCLPFEALVDDQGRYLIETYRFAYLSSGRDLLQAHPQPGHGTVVFAGPDYDLGAARRHAAAEPLLAALPAGPTPALRGAISRDLRGGAWKPLKGAAAEAALIREALRESRYGPVTIYSGPEALEEVFKAVHGPRVLHVDTHGFFLPDKELHPEDQHGPIALGGLETGAARGLARLRGTENPLLRSGLVLAGANTLGERAGPANAPGERADAAPTVDDGLVTAEEIALMDLRGTELVVLSACETGLGRVKIGEGVYGLRRAFLYAGARTLVTSLFKVPDEQTCELMGRFYGALKAGQGKLEALHGAQLELLRQRRAAGGVAHPFFWASFVLVGDPE